jgi:capping protein alpha
LSSPALTASSGPAVLRQIAGIEKRYQEELNRAFGSLSEGAFKALRRQLPVTRQKVEWERVGGYRVRLPQRPGWIVSRLTVRMV